MTCENCSQPDAECDGYNCTERAAVDAAKPFYTLRDPMTPAQIESAKAATTAALQLLTTEV